jgi:hypothetical protein
MVEKIIILAAVSFDECSTNGFPTLKAAAHKRQAIVDRTMPGSCRKADQANLPGIGEQRPAAPGCRQNREEGSERSEKAVIFPLRKKRSCRSCTG